MLSAVILVGFRYPAVRLAPQPVYLKIESGRIAPASVLTLQTLDTIRHFQCHNIFVRLHNLL